MRYFIDTSAFVAVSDRSDQYHSSATRFFQEQLDPSDQLHTSNYVIDETITRLRGSAGMHVAIKFAESVYASRIYQIHSIDRELELETLRLFKRYHDQDLSFTDCTTLALANRLSIHRLFAYDRAFQNLGYQLVPGF